ncbi:hypothetical protein [Halorussus salinisoli]|nr:hypothetical protein [Halorussus salinisoli]
MNWADLFERGEAYETDVATIREALASRRDHASEGTGSESENASSEGEDA